MEITSQVYTYKELKEGLDLGRDDYGIAAMCSKPLQEAFKANPYLSDDDSLFMHIERVDGIAAAIGMWFPTKLKVGNEILNSTGGSTLEVYEKYRKYELGVDMMLYPNIDNGFKFFLFAGVSEQALKMYKVLRFTVFEYPRSMRVCNSRSIIESKGIHGILLKVATSLVNLFLKAWYLMASCLNTCYKDYTVRKLEKAPLWIDDMVLNEGHKYMEVHDHQWFQWNLDYNLHAEKNDIQSLYGVYKDDIPVAFFLTKERFRNMAGGSLKDIVIGSIMEWGVERNSKLNEADLYKMALKTFSKKVDIIEFATDNSTVVKKMKKYGFIPHGFAHIVLKDLMKKYKDAKDMSQWRIRFAYSDVFLT